VNNADCERVRLAVMASLDGEGDPQSVLDRAHLSTCTTCGEWLKDLQSITGRLQGLSYQRAPVDLWTAVESRVRVSEQSLTLPRRILPIGATVLGWRALQLFFDLPVPQLHPLVALLGTAAAVWMVARDPLAIETSAPELKKRGV
jgi:hypothetical protein